MNTYICNQILYFVFSHHQVSLKPAALAATEAAGLIYSGLVAWDALFVTGGLGGALTKPGQGMDTGKRVCILGASGGVGSIAVQIAKAENAEVTATCSRDAVSMVEKLGADFIIDYTNSDSTEMLRTTGPYSLVLDCAGRGSETKYWTQIPCSFAQYITLSPPVLKNFDSHGLVLGSFKSIFNLVGSNAHSIVSNQALVKWPLFVPVQQGFEYLTNLVDNKKVSFFFQRVN